MGWKIRSHHLVLIAILFTIGTALPKVHATPTLTIFPTSIAANQNIAASYIVNLIGGTPNATYALTLTGLPSAASYSFSSTLMGASGGSILTIQTSIPTPLYCPGSYTFTVTATNIVLSTDSASAIGSLHVNNVGPGLAVSVSSTKSTYIVGDTVTISLASNRPAKGNLTIVPPTGSPQVYPYSSISPPMKTLTVNLPGTWKVMLAADDYCGASANEAMQFDVESLSTSSSTSLSATSITSLSNLTISTITSKLTSTSVATTTTNTVTSTTSSVTLSSVTTEMGTLTETNELTATSTTQETVSISTSLAQVTTTSTPVSPTPPNPPLELLLGIILVVSVLTISITLIRQRSRSTPVTCSNCGFKNPASASHFCINCGQPFKRR